MGLLGLASKLSRMCFGSPSDNDSLYRFKTRSGANSCGLQAQTKRFYWNTVEKPKRLWVPFHFLMVLTFGCFLHGPRRLGDLAMGRRRCLARTPMA
jgi:hypothetical protein